MAKPSKSKNTSEADDEVLNSGKKLPSTDNITGVEEVKMAKRVISKRSKVVVSCTSAEHSRTVEAVFSNEDLLTEILSLVPAKPLLKFKSVSKHWYSLISNSKFASNHACQNSNSSLISGLYLFDRSYRTWSSKGLKSV